MNWLKFTTQGREVYFNKQFIVLIRMKEESKETTRKVGDESANEWIECLVG